MNPPTTPKVPPCDILLRLRQWEPDCVRSPSAGRQVRLRRARFDSQGCQVDGRLRPLVSKERVNTLRLYQLHTLLDRAGLEQRG